MRLFTSVLASAAIALVASSASANVVFNNTTTGADPLNLQIGDIITLNIRLSNNSAADFIAGVGGAVFNYAPVMSFVDAESADTNLFCTNAGSTCSNGLVSSFNASDPNPPVEGTTAATGKFVLFVNAIATNARNGNGAKDPGIDGVVNGGDAEFRIRLQASAPGSTDIIIGTNTDSATGAITVVSTAISGGTVDPARQGVNAIVHVNVVPEPGTALLMGLGLAGLAVAGRRN